MPLKGEPDGVRSALKLGILASQAFTPISLIGLKPGQPKHGPRIVEIILFRKDALDREGLKWRRWRMPYQAAANTSVRRVQWGLDRMGKKPLLAPPPKLSRSCGTTQPTKRGLKLIVGEPASGNSDCLRAARQTLILADSPVPSSDSQSEREREHGAQGPELQSRIPPPPRERHRSWEITVCG